MKKIFKKLSFSTLKKNPAFSAGLFIMLVFMALVSALSASLGNTVQGSVDDFIESKDMPDGWITTEMLEENKRDDIEDITGVKSVVSSVVLPVKTKLPSGNELSLTFFGIDENETSRFYIKEEAQNLNNLPKVWVTAYFADKNGVEAGSELTVSFGPYEERVQVKGLFSTPETMKCVRSETSWGDAAGYGYIFMLRDEADILFGTSEKANYWSIHIDDDLSVKERQEVIDKAGELFGDKTLSTLLYDTSLAKSLLDDMMNTVRSICNSFPLVIFGAGLFFMILFVSQTIRGRSEDIGLLIALGHSRKEVVMIFFRYLVVLLIPGVIVGSFAGIAMTMILSGLFANMYSLPQVLLRVDVIRYAIMIILEIGLCLISCVVSAFLVIKVDPAKAMRGGITKVSNVPSIIRGLKIGPFFKMGLASLFKDRRRTLLSILSIAVCIMLSAGSLEYMFGFNDALPRTFEKRYTYDALISVKNGWEDFSEIETVEGVSIAEPVISFMTDFENGDHSMRIKVNAIRENSELIVPYTKDYLRVPLSSGVILDEWTSSQMEVLTGDTVSIEGINVPVTGIARNLVDRTEYISFETAEKMGYKAPDTVAVKIDAKANREEVLKDIMKLPGCQYISTHEQQRTAQEDNSLLVKIAITGLQVVAILNGMIIILIMVALSIRERKHEFAVLIALGVQDAKFAKMIIIENVAIFVTASMIALPASFFGSCFMNALMSRPSQVIEVFNFGKAFGIAIGLAFIYFAAGVISGIVKLYSIDAAENL